MNTFKISQTITSVLDILSRIGWKNMYTKLARGYNDLNRASTLVTLHIVVQADPSAIASAQDECTVICSKIAVRVSLRCYRSITRRTPMVFYNHLCRWLLQANVFVLESQGVCYIGVVYARHNASLCSAYE